MEISYSADKIDRATLLLEQMKNLSGLLIDQLAGEGGESLTLAAVISEKAEAASALLAQQ